MKCFAHNVFFSRQIILNFAQITATSLPCSVESFQIDLITSTVVMDERDFAKFEFEMSFEWLSYIATAHWILCLSPPWWRHQMESFSALLGFHRSPANSPNKGQWRGALMFSLICTWINGYANNRKAGDLRLHHAHYDLTVISITMNISTIHDLIFGVLINWLPSSKPISCNY